MVLTLKNSDSIDAIHAPYAIGLIKAFRVLESKWEQLCEDIENGFPCLEINDVRIRDSVVEVLGGPQPDLSNKIRLIFEDKIGVGFCINYGLMFDILDVS